MYTLNYLMYTRIHTDIIHVFRKREFKILFLVFLQRNGFSVSRCARCSQIRIYKITNEKFTTSVFLIESGKNSCRETGGKDRLE